MIRFFEKDGKYNFVDDRNVLAGFDSEPECCEDFGWVFIDFAGNEHPELASGDDKAEFPDLVFNTDVPLDFDIDEIPVDEGGTVGFPVINLKTNDEYLLVFYNAHNGYYHHGWEYKKDGKIIDEGQI